MDSTTDKIINQFIYFYLFCMIVASAVIYQSQPSISFIVLVLGGIITGVMFSKKTLFKELVNTHISERIASIEMSGKSSFKTFPISIAIINRKTFQITWSNKEFAETFNKSENVIEQYFPVIIPEITTATLKNYYTSFPVEITINQSIYRTYAHADTDSPELLNLYFVDVTDDAKMRNHYEKTKPIVSIISIDNYDELLRNTTDTEKSIIVAAVNTRINAWTKEVSGIFRKIDRDRYLFIFQNSEIDEFTSKKFPVLDSIREIQTTEGITATLSIGIGRDGDTLQECYNFAMNALDMALSRGGDQAVIKNKFSFEFYGGMSKEVEKRTKVKSRVIANALTQIITDSDDVFIMGHQVSDFDSLGSAIGMCAGVRNIGKPVKIVIDLNKTSAMPLAKKILQDENYKDIFISPEDALIKLSPKTLLIVVDTNNPKYVESRSVLDSALKVVVIDHHRRSADYIENATVNMHEPYASSASEIVTELLQYMINNSKISKLESEALLCGIMLDTKMFSSKTGSRTFEAAAYLRRIGADIDAVKLLFKSDYETYVTKQKINANAKRYNEKFIISTTVDEVERSVASSCADQLLDILDIQASFVVFKTPNGTNISARSNSKINVQLIMEQLGGGGSINAAACQFDTDTTENVERLLKHAINKYIADAQEQSK